MLEKANKIKSNDPYIIDSLGWALFKLKRYKESKDYLQLAVKLMPADPIVNDHYGDVLWKNGNKIQARYYWSYDAGINIDPSEGNSSSLPPFNPPWNDGNASNWSDWCDFELTEGCYACQNNSGAGLYCNDHCAAAGCSGFTASVPASDDNNSVGQGIGSRISF